MTETRPDAAGQPYTVLCTYLVKRERVGQMRDLLHRHWPALRRRGLVTSTPPVVYYGEDHSGPFFVEILTWTDDSATGRAYWDDEINAIWADLYAWTEARGDRPGIEYPAVEYLDCSSQVDASATVAT